jgi:hypothetical protein
MIVGSGHSAFNAVLEMVELARQEPTTTIIWAVRRSDLDSALGGGDVDQLAERGRLGERVRSTMETGSVQLFQNVSISSIESTPEGLVAQSRGLNLPGVDEIIVATGFRPDRSLLAELRVSLDSVVESPVQLAPLIDPNIHSCGTVPPHGAHELAHPDEPGLYIVGMKSYGRAPTFLTLTGYEQVRSVVAALIGDWDGAREVRLVLPESGVCSAGSGSSCETPAPDFGTSGVPLGQRLPAVPAPLQ